MIGNDIVDLAQAKRESNWQRRGFLEKIFTSCEQRLIHQATDPDQLVWLLWSMKESAYKLTLRRSRNRVFAPRKLACTLIELTDTTCIGTVDYAGQVVVKSCLTTDYISTIAHSTGVVPAFTEVILPLPDSAYQTQHRVIREHIKIHGSALFAVSEQAIYIQKDKAGIPALQVGNLANLSLSISHHGHFGAYVIENMLTVLPVC